MVTIVGGGWWWQVVMTGDGDGDRWCRWVVVIGGG